MIHPFLKRGLDVMGAAAGLLCMIPFFPLVALAIKLDSSGPVLVKLNRVSSGRTIKVYKFRSMTANAHELKESLRHLNERADGPFFKIRHDPRLTRVGTYLRKCRADELPQLINVLKGELSLVGPRPHEPEEVAHYPEIYRHLASAKAGATGLSQVSGASGLSFLKELELDDYYLTHQSLWFDCRIIAKTLAILFTDRNAV